MNTSEENLYRAYILRLWRNGTDQPWRVTLLSVGSDEAPRHFATMAQVLTFLGETTPSTLPAASPISMNTCKSKGVP